MACPQYKSRMWSCHTAVPAQLPQTFAQGKTLLPPWAPGPHLAPCGPHTTLSQGGPLPSPGLWDPKWCGPAHPWVSRPSASLHTLCWPCCTTVSPETCPAALAPLPPSHPPISAQMQASSPSCASPVRAKLLLLSS